MAERVRSFPSWFKQLMGCENRGAKFFLEHAKAQTTFSDLNQGSCHRSNTQNRTDRTALAWSILDSLRREGGISSSGGEPFNGLCEAEALDG